jgi:DNA-binding response OmpR family regulator
LLLVEDDHVLRIALTATLRGAGHDVVAVASAEEADDRIAAQEIDLVVLDWGLPGVSGIELVESWRAAGGRVPVVFLTARAEVVDRVRGLQAGADDYVTKPFASEELLARIEARLRRQPSADRRITVSGIDVDLSRGEVVRDGRTLQLTTQESSLLRYLSARPGELLDRDTLLRDVWGYRAAPAVTRAVDNTIARLRAKIERDPTAPRHVLTVHGSGYRFEP